MVELVIDKNKERRKKYSINISKYKMKNMAIIRATGTSSLSKRFVKRVVETGYEVQKINPARACRELVRVFVPQGHPEDERLFHAGNEFIRKEDAHYLYVENKLKEFSDGEKNVAILVNVSNELLSEIECDFEAFSVSLSSYKGKNGDESNGHDYTIFNNDDFDSRVDKLLRVLTKDIEDVKYKEEIE